MILEPYNNKLIISEIEIGEYKSSGGVLFDSSNAPNLKKGEIVSKGPNCSSQFEVGKIVYFLEMVGIEIFHEGVKYLLLNEYEALYFEKMNNNKSKDTLFIG